MTKFTRKIKKKDLTKELGDTVLVLTKAPEDDEDDLVVADGDENDSDEE